MDIAISMATWKTAAVVALAISIVTIGTESAEVGSLNTEQNRDDGSRYHNREILLDIFQATGGLDWKDSTNWIQQKIDVCDWKGVQCYPESESDERRIGNIKSLDLSDNHLVGTIPPQVFEIPYLKTLILDDNSDLDIDLSGLPHAQFLTELAISNTQVNSLEGIGEVPQLEVLHITGLNLRGSLPSDLFELTGLTDLFANFNKFDGRMPTLIGRLSNLRNAYLYDNDLTGQIPTEIGLLSRLEVLSLGQNAFGGTLPTQLESLTNMQVLSIQREGGKEKGNGIGGSLPSFGEFRYITELYLDHQRLTGSIGQDFLSRAPNDELVKVDLSSNMLDGTVPGSLVDKKFLSIYLQDNKINAVSGSIYNRNSGTCPDISNWMIGDVSDFGCDAFLCPPGTWAAEGRATASNQCASCSDDATIWGRVTCDSSTPSDVKERQVLVNLYNRMGGRYWKEDRNWLNFATDICLWYGIQCNSQDQVTSINLANNGLSNSPPQEIFDLPALSSLNLNTNSIDFNFSGIGKAQRLRSLDLSNTRLSSSSLDNLSELASLNQLESLSIAANGLEGSIPASLFQLTGLKDLDISQNKFSGPLPTLIGRMTQLLRFRCDGNDFTGQLPTEIGNMKLVQEISAAENRFEGSLPTQLNLLWNLESLSLHQTSVEAGIRGPLLPFDSLSQLTSLQLDSNRLTGSLPVDFLRNSQKTSQRIDISLSDNQLQGTVPGAWSRFGNLFLDLSGNKIMAINDNLCDMNDWMDGAVRQFGCDAILCPSSTYNDIGRESGDGETCLNCPGGQQRLGAKQCDSNGAGTEDSELDILSAFFYSTNGNDWKDKTDWTVSNDHCSWFGIECNGAGSVTRITLPDNELTGTPDTSIFQLPSLRELVLSGNSITFSFGGISNAQSLLTLNLSKTGLTSVEGIGSAPSLVNLYLRDNHLQGEIPDELYSLDKMRGLYLGFNQLSGDITGSALSWTGIETLELQHNNYAGPIPAILGSLTSLKKLNLAENNFDGTIPPELNRLTNLEFLSIQREGGIGGVFDVGIDQGASSVQGQGLTGTLPAFDNLQRIKELYLGVNSLTGPVPFAFLDGVLEKKTSEIKVDLTSNRLTGTLPASLTQFDRLSLYVAGNRITDIPEGLCLEGEWLGGDVATYGCDGILCPANTFNPLGRKTTSASLCQSCGQGTNGYLGSFSCLDAGDQQAQSERAILERIYNDMDGENWVYSHNWMDRDESICTWYGITCLSDDQESVVSIHLEGNRLRYSLPSQIYNLPNLQELNLQGNSFVFTTSGIGNANNLEYLDLEETGLEDLDGIERASGLKVLLVDGNRFSNFPQSILQLGNLEVLSLSHNVFKGEDMPSSLQFLGNLVHFSCSECGFAGTIPAWLGSLQNLEYLQLDRNGFTGALPAQLGNLGKLQHLNLGDQLSHGGGISGNLMDFSLQTQLSELILHHNYFTGVIPTTLLRNMSTSDLATIDLRFNFLSGAVPTELGAIGKLNLYVAGNSIDTLPPQLCQKSWNEGNTQKHGCDGILCGKGTFNAYGRAVGDLECSPCESDGAQVQYFGATRCGKNYEHTILTRLYRDTNGPNWKRDTNWLKDDDHCTWEGITCYDDGEYEGLVKDIDLGDNNMIGSTFATLWQLVGLKTVNFRKNDIKLSFGTLIEAVNLETMILSETFMESLEGISGAPSLKSLHVTNSNLMGPIPDELFDMTQLEEIYLSYNDLTGTLSTRFGQLKSLRDLYVFGNYIQGTIPSELGLVSSLQHMVLGENELSGSIPRQIMSLPFLEVLSFHRENVDTGPDTPLFQVGGGGLGGTLPAFAGLPRLRKLYLGSNEFYGSIPDNFLQGIRDKDQQIEVDLTFNNLDGNIPKQLANFKNMNLYVAGNSFTGVDREICLQSDWMNGEIGAGCDALMCLPGTYNEFGRRVDSETPCEVCTYPGFPQDIFGKTDCGPIMADSFDDRSILFEVYDMTAGEFWTKSTDWKRDDKPVCDWFGVHCEPVGEMGTMTVTELNLSSNNLNGIIPSILFHLPALRKLDVRDNLDVQVTFNAIHQTDTIEELWLDRTRVSNLDGINQAKSLKILSVSGNSFGWKPIPDPVFELDSLTTLDLSASRFAGTLSSKIGQLTSLKSLNLIGNELNGQIPPEIGNLVALEKLELSNNDFFGTLPESLSGLVSLVSLYLDNTKRASAGITGPLRPFSTMPSLRDINISGNQLTGSIPANFLSGVTDVDALITVRIQANELIGTVPSELSKFNKLDIDVTDNLIVAIGDGLCQKSDWLDGNVGLYSCDGILCPAGEFSKYGRQTSEDSKCMPCPGAESSPYLGVSKCLSLERKREREILEELFKATNGENWKNNDGWLDDAVDMCDWYGIKCLEEATIESILLGSNHLVGTTPKSLFELPNLKFLWLYSNPVTFSFAGIEKATSLRSLYLDSTGLESLEGVGAATSLVELDVRFNRLRGSLPKEMDNLINLENFSGANNLLSGPVPEFLGNPRLNSLFLGSNSFSGPLPPFARLSELKSLDLSQNKLTGTIPENLLETADVTQSTFLDLSGNQLTGTAPGWLSRFDDLTVYLRDNRIEGLDPGLCAKVEWNGGDVGSFKCDGILCPSGTYSSTGRASTTGARCEPCKRNKYFGSSTCGSAGSSSFQISVTGCIVSLAVAIYATLF